MNDQIAWLVRARMVPTQTERLANALADHHRMRWVRSTHDGGELVYGLVSVDPATDGVLQRLPDLPGVLALTPYELLWTWPRHGEAPATPPAPLDALDQMIIAALGENGRTTNRELARRARVDETTIGRRRARLEHSGVLYYEADIPQNALGRSIDAMLWIDASPGHIEETGARLHQTPECRFVAVTTGPTNVVANVVAETTRALITFTDRYLNEHVNRVEMQILGREFKRLA